jgi:hypothetical protein
VDGFGVGGGAGDREFLRQVVERDKVGIFTKRRSGTDKLVSPEE